MEKKYKSLSIYEFQEIFPDDESCKAYLAEKKWTSGYCCKKCHHSSYRKGSKGYVRKCNKCDYAESATANTLFHHLKFPIHKAFAIVYYLSTSKKGIASTELSRKLGLNQKSAWLFKRKIMKAMVSSGNHLLSGMVEIDETFLGGKETGQRGRKPLKKRQIVFAIERKNGGISRAYGRVIENAGTKQLRPFIEKCVDKAAQLKTDKWRGYTPLNEDFNIKQVDSNQGRNFPQMHRFIMNFKGWIRGVHHNVRQLQDYIDEYTYRFNIRTSRLPITHL